MRKVNDGLVVLQCTQANKSGAARYVHELVTAMRSCGQDVVVVCPEDYEHRADEIGGECISFPSVRGAGRAAKLYAMICQFVLQTKIIIGVCQANGGRRVLAHFNFPGIHFLAVAQFFFLKAVRVDVILTVHDVVPHRWIFPRMMKGVEARVLKALYGVPNGLVVHHESQAEELINQFHVQRDKICVTHHGVFRLADRVLPFTFSDDFTVLCFGAIRENKGLHLAIEAVQILRRKGRALKLIIAGAASQGEAGYWRDCKAMIESDERGIEVFEGYVRDEEVVELFKRAHIVLLPYSDFFSQSGVATMALSSGRAIASTRVGGLDEMLQSGRFGVVIEEANSTGVVNALEAAMNLGQERLKQMGCDGFSFFEEEYSWSKAAKEQLDFYDRVLA